MTLLQVLISCGFSSDATHRQLSRTVAVCWLLLAFCATPRLLRPALLHSKYPPPLSNFYIHILFFQKNSRRLWRSQRRKSSSVRRGQFSSSRFPCRKVPRPWQGKRFALPENRGIIFQQRRKLPESLSSREFRTATAFSSFLIFWN